MGRRKQKKLNYVVPRRLIERRSYQTSLETSIGRGNDKETMEDLRFEEGNL